MSSSLLPTTQQWFDNNGNPLADEFIYTYISGTSTLKTTYTNPQLTIANTNPIELDAAGRATVYGSGNYSIEVQTSLGATVTLRNNIFLGDGAIAVAGDAWFDVRTYGAVGDGVTDDTSALQAALDAAGEAGNLATVYTPAGFNCSTGPLYIDVGLRILGGRFIKQGNSTPGSGTTYDIRESAWSLRSGSRLLQPRTNTTDVSGGQIEGMVFYGRGRNAGFDDGAYLGWGNGAPAYGDPGWVTLAGRYFEVTKCKFSNFGRNGIEISDAGFGIEIHGNYFTNNGPLTRGALSLRRGGVFVRNLTFYRPTPGSTAGANASTGISIHDNYFAAGSRGIGCDGQSQYDDWGKNLFEFNDVGIECLSSLGLNITGGKFEGNLTAGVMTTDIVSFGHFSHPLSGVNTILASDGYIHGDDGSLFLSNGSNGSAITLNTEVTDARGITIRSDFPQITFSGTGAALNSPNNKLRIRAGNSTGNMSFQRATAVDADGNITAADDFITIASSGKITFETGADAEIDMGGAKLSNVVDPTTAQQAATKAYVDARTPFTSTFAAMSAVAPVGRITYTTDTDDLFVADGATQRSMWHKCDFLACTNGATTIVGVRGARIVNTTATTIAAHTITLPSGATNAAGGDEVSFRTHGAITALTINAGAATVVNNITTLAAGKMFLATYNASNTTWYITQ